LAKLREIMTKPLSLRFSSRVLLCCLVALITIAPESVSAAGKSPAFTFCCASNNDLFLSLTRAGEKYPRFSTAGEAINSAAPGSAVLILADNYPAQTVSIADGLVALALKKDLRIYLEYYAPDFPGFHVDAPKNSVWERVVVASDDFGPTLPKLRILALHDCHFTSVIAEDPLLVVARVAGFDTAVYGLPANAQPILWENPTSHFIIATTRLSGFIQNRFAPAIDITKVWETILTRLDPQHAPHKLKWKPPVTPAFSRDAKLPRAFEKKAFANYARWITNSRLLVSPDRKPSIEKLMLAGVETAEMPAANAPNGDGSLGILEGYASGIRADGTQLQRIPLRDDCNSEMAMVLSLDAAVNHHARSAVIASNLLDYIYFNSDICKFERADPKHGAFGLLSWGAVAPAWRVANYGDDNANGMLSTMAVSACLKNSRWDEMLLRALLANLRTTGKLGFRGDRIDLPALAQGWRQFHDASPVNYSPHFESYLWACDLWACEQTGFQPFLQKATNAIAMTMKAYPGGWRWGDNLERAHMLLCLAWLVRVQDTPEHRQWLQTVAGDLLQHQDACGAIHEWLAGTGGGHYRIPQSNEAYGTGETPLIQKNGDPASDQLYTTGFALLGLHEAAAATGDAKLKLAEDRLAEFLCRVQIKSATFPWLDGAWFRAFDDGRWEFWASSADIGWGAWSVEAGWGQSWTAATLALRQKNTTLWDFTKNARLKTLLPAVKVQFSTKDEDF
jgi:hypothetical protein